MNDNTQYYSCACHVPEHVVRTDYDTDPDWQSFIISTQLAPLHPWYTRLIIAFYYTLGMTRNWSHWHETELDIPNAIRLRGQLDNFINETAPDIAWEEVTKL